MRARFLVPAAAGALLFLTSAAVAAPPRFAAPFLSYTAGVTTRVMTVADVNDDGHPDVLVSNASGLEVRLGVGDGTLGPPQLSAGAFQAFVMVGDLDGDGWKDVVLSADSLHVGVSKGNGDGTFQAPVLYTVAKGPVNAALVDLNGDGKLDLVCSAQNAHVVSILLGDGAGGFGTPNNVSAGTYPGAIATGDLDHDGDADVVVADRGGNAFVRLLGDGAGHLVNAGSTSLGSVSPQSLVLADMNGDTWLDAVTGSTYTAEFLVVPGGSGGFGTPLSRTVGDMTSGLAVADFDADGHPDVAVLDYNLNRGDVRRGLGAFAFAPAQPFGAGRNSYGVVAADLNGGGKPDLVTLCPYGPIAVHMGNGDGTFGGVQDVATGPLPWGIASGDLDGDGHPDLVTTNIGNSTLSVRFGTGGAAFTAPVTLTTGIEPHGVTIADADGDGHLDIVVAENGPGTQASSTVAIFRGDGARGFGPRIPITVGRWAQEVAVGDLTGDGLPDLAVACNDYISTLTVLRGLGNAQWGSRQDWVLGSNASAVAIGDVTRDGKPDVVLAAYYSNNVHVLPGFANGTWGSPLTIQVSGPGDVSIGDVVGDASPDLIVSTPSGVSLIASTPGGGFDPPVALPGLYGGSTAIADLDADGRVDVVHANGWPSNTVSLWSGLGGGGLASPIAFGAGDRPSGVTAADLDGDGLLDLACANLESSTISLLLNTGGAAWLPWLGAPPPRPPSALTLRARPNPILGAGSIEYALPRTQHVTLRLLDVAGRELARLDDGERSAGPHAVPLRTSDLHPGVAFLELRADSERVVQQVVVLR